jgi:hypothetical protein
MKIEIHRTTMTDGQKVTDVDIMPNTRVEFKPRCIMTFNSGDRALDFAHCLKDLCTEFDMTCTTEVVD